jgi:pilus assembly protein CpaF
VGLSERLAAVVDDAPAVGAAAPVPPVDRESAPRRPVREQGLRAAKDKVRALVLDEVAPRMAGLDAAALQIEVRSALDRILEREDVRVSPRDRAAFVEAVVADTLGYGPLDPLLRDDSVTEIMCNGHDEIWIERHGRLVEVDTAFADDDHYRKVIERIVSAVGRRVDESSPMVDARLPDGSRVNAVIPPLAVGGSVLTIRKFAADPLTAVDLVAKGTYTLDLVTVLEASVRGRLNVLVSGGTGTGKTTNLNVMSSFVPDGERIITIEDSAELQLQQRHVVSLEARPPNAEGRGEVLIRDLVRNALRMRPDRIIVGECRAAETLDMLQAMNTGHEGSMTTVHANTPRDALSRLETMVLMAGFDLPVRAIREQVAAAIDLILQVDRLPDGRRIVTALTEVQGLEGEAFLLQDVFRFRSDGPDDTGTLVATGLRPKLADRLAEAGIDLPASAFRAPERAPAPSRRRGAVPVPAAGAVAARRIED